jgi:hypothetical protein
MDDALMNFGRDARTTAARTMLGGTSEPLAEKALPLLARGRDVVVLARLGDSQLPAVVAPILAALPKSGKGPYALFLSADKELFASAHKALQSLRGPRPVICVALSEEKAVRKEAKDLADRPDVVVSTPARLIDHIRRHQVSLTGVRCAVILETPTESGEFRRDVQFIYSKLPRRRQTVLLASGLSRDTAAETYVLRRPAYLEPADIAPPPPPPAPPPRQRQENRKVSTPAESISEPEARRQGPDDKAIGDALATILTAIRQQENPDELNRFRSILKKHVPIFMRSYVAAYLLKKSLAAHVVGPIDTTTLFVSIGKNRRVFPKDLVKLFMDRLSIDRAQLGDVKVLDSYAFVDISLDHAQEAISKLSGTNFRGRRLTVNVARKKGEGKEPRE